MRAHGIIIIFGTGWQECLIRILRVGSFLIRTAPVRSSCFYCFV